MKISSEMRSKPETKQSITSSKATVQTDFKSVVAKEQKQLQNNELTRLIEQLNKQGEKIVKFRSFNDLSQYKRLVKKFVEEAVQYGLDLKHSRNWNRSGQNRKLSIIEKIDEKLVELTDFVLEQEKQSIDILGKIDEIKGLLVNLYT